MSAAEKLAQDIAKASPWLVQVRHSGNSYRVACPCHDDKKKDALAIYESGAVKCYGGCTYKAIHDWCTEHGIEWLKSNSSRVDVRKEYTAQPHFPPEIQSLPNALTPWRYNGVEFKKPNMAWALRSEPNGVIYEFVCRFNMPDGTKEMRPLSYWLHNSTGAPAYHYLGGATDIKPLYGAEWLAAKPNYGIVVVEGEKTRDYMQRFLDENQLEYLAVTSAYGANKEHKSDWSVLRVRREIIFWGDNDLTGPKAGVGYVIRVGRILQEFGLSLRRVVLPAGMPNKWDIADWFEPKQGQEPLPDGFEPLDTFLGAPAWTPPPVGLDEEQSVFSQREGDQLVEALNREYLVIEGRNLEIIHERHSSRGIEELLDISVASFTGFYRNKIVLVPKDDSDKMTSIKLGEYWLNHPKWRQYRYKEFLPGKATPADTYNLFSGFIVKPDKNGCCDLLWQHLQENICQGDDASYKWKRQLISHIFQRPWELPKVSVTLISEVQGTGKDIFFDIIGHLLGRYYIKVQDIDQLTGRFNEHLEFALLVHLEEAINASNARERNKLKTIISAEQALIEGKGKKPYMAKSYGRKVYTSNNEEAVHVSGSDRRNAVFRVGTGWREQVSATEWREMPFIYKGKVTTYFKAMMEQMREGGLGRLMYDLLAEDLSNFNPHQQRSPRPFSYSPPRSQQRIEHSMPKYHLKHGLEDLDAHIADYHDRFLTGPNSHRDAIVTGLIYDLATILSDKLAKKLVKQIKAAGFDTGNWGEK